MKLVHIISGLGTGGAEMMLYRLLSALDRSEFNCSVISLLDRGTLGERIEQLGVPVYPLGMRRGLPTPTALLRLRRLIRDIDADLLQGWMYHGNIAASLVAMGMQRQLPIAWNIRHSLHDPASERRLTRGVIWAGARLSGGARLRSIIYNSRVSARQHAACGYAPEKGCVITNGFDTGLFRPDPAAAARLRAEWGIPPDGRLLGLFGRYHPVKNQRGFLQAAVEIIRCHPDSYLVLAGRGVERQNSLLLQQVEENNLQHRCLLLGERDDMPALLPAMDIVCSASQSEGLPNVIGEAMACGVPCVVTDVGDSALLVGDTGRVVPAGQPEALADAVNRLLALTDDERRLLGEAARRRIRDEYALEAVAERYRVHYQQIMRQ